MSTTDPVEAKSGFLKMYMSSHPDTLIAYAKFYGKVEGAMFTAEMTNINTKGMTLTYTRKPGGDKAQVYVPIEPPLSGYEDVKPRLLEMKAHAQEGLGMIKAPKITTYQFPTDAWKTALFFGALGYLTLAPNFDTSVAFFQPGQYMHAPIGATPLKYLWAALGVIHVFESMYTARLCSQHGTGLLVGTGYVLTTLIFGGHVWKLLRRRIQEARIASVMKVQ